MKKAFLVLGIIVLSMGINSCEDAFCNWYVYDAQGILTGYTDSNTCHDWAAEWDDVTCTCE
jgi:hypothetical protein